MRSLIAPFVVVGPAGARIRTRLRPSAADGKRALTPASSSRWAGAITRTSNDQWQRGRRNLLDARDGYWQAPLMQQTKTSVAVSRHHAAAVVIGRRGLGYRAGDGEGVPGGDRRIANSELPTPPGRP